MFRFHEAETCEGVIEHLERREGALRHYVRVRDRGNIISADARVEMTFWLGDQLYAIEHTGIEPFDGFMEHQNRSRELFKPLETAITTALGALLAPGVVIEMHIPVDAFNGRKMPEVRSIQAGLVDYVRNNAAKLPARKYGDYRGTLLTGKPESVPFSVSLVRFDGLGSLPGYFLLKHLTRGSEEPRARRIERACERKFPKLAVWKGTDNARTILVLEDNDVQLTNQSVVAETFLPLAVARSDAPDETYMVATCTSPWRAWPILVDGRTYFELAAIRQPVHFEMGATGHLVT